MDKILEKFRRGNSAVAKTPIDTSQHLSKNKGKNGSQNEYASVICSLIYLMNCIRTDLAYTVSTLSQFTSNPGMQHWSTIVIVLRYLRYS